MQKSPIADLSYRHYDGPLNSPAARWWSIARLTMQVATKKRGFWFWAVAAGYWYYALLMIFWFIDTFLPVPTADGRNRILVQVTWQDQFINGFAISQLGLFIVTLFIGAGVIANDNRSNALLVYLSKPCTKLDYVVGKWLGLFIPIATATALPMMFFYLYCAMSFRTYGFFADPWMGPKLLLICTLPATFHASVILGISSLFNQARIAGAVYAGLYFLPWFFTKAIQFVRFFVLQDGKEAPKLLDTLYYCSIDGIQIGLAKCLLKTNGSSLFPDFGMRTRPRVDLPVPYPSLALFGTIFLVISVVGFAIAWNRVRAVEVI